MLKNIFNFNGQEILNPIKSSITQLSFFRGEKMGVKKLQHWYNAVLSHFLKLDSNRGLIWSSNNHVKSNS